MSSHTGSGADRQVVSLLNECGGPAVPLGHFGWPCSPRRQALRSSSLMVCCAVVCDSSRRILRHRAFEQVLVGSEA